MGGLTSFAVSCSAVSYVKAAYLQGVTRRCFRALGSSRRKCTIFPSPLSTTYCSMRHATTCTSFREDSIKLFANGKLSEGHYLVDVFDKDALLKTVQENE